MAIELFGDLTKFAKYVKGSLNWAIKGCDILFLMFLFQVAVGFKNTY